MCLSLQPERIRGVELGEQVCELAERSTEGVVFAVVEGMGEVIAAPDRVFAVRGAVGFVRYEVDFSQELLFVVFEFADHDCGG